MTRAALLFAALVASGCASSAPKQKSAPPASPGAASMTAPAPVVLSEEPWSFEGSPGRIIRTHHYRIYTTDPRPVITDRLPGFLETALDHYRSGLGSLPGPSTRLDTYLLTSRPQWQRATLRLLGEAGKPFTNIGRGGFATRGIAMLYDIGVFDTLAIAAHEGWHQYTQRTFREPLPMWFEEGIATYMEGHKWAGDEPVFLPWANIGRFDALAEAVNAGEFVPLEALLTTRLEDNLAQPSERGVSYYAHVWALVHFLNEGEGGRRRAALRALVLDAAEGRLRAGVARAMGERAADTVVSMRNGPGVFLAYFGDDLSEVGRSYEEFVRAAVRPGARDLVAAGRSPFGYSEPADVSRRPQ